MSNAQTAIDKVLIHEGGFVNHPLDKGGPTNFGITQAVYEEFVGRKVTLEEMKNMPIGNAVRIYKEKYWDKVQGDKIRNYAIAFTIFDQAVNRGPSSAIKQAQKILGLNQTGIADDSFINKLNFQSPDIFVNQYIEASKDFYYMIVRNNSSQSVFLNGWLARIESLKSYASSNLDKITSAVQSNPIAIAVPALAILGLGIYLYTSSRKIA